MTNRQAREIAKDILQDTIAVAYYKLNESFKYEDLTEEEKDMINCFLTQYARHLEENILLINVPHETLLTYRRDGEKERK